MNKADKKLIKILLICLGALLIILLIGSRLFQNALKNPTPTVFHDIQCKIFAGGVEKWTTIPIGLMPDYSALCYQDYALETLNVEFCYRGRENDPLEGCIYDIATNKSDIKLCGKIETEWRRTECINYINGVLTK